MVAFLIKLLVVSLLVGTLGVAADGVVCTAPADAKDFVLNKAYVACLRTNQCVDIADMFNGQFFGVPMAAGCGMALPLI